MADISDDAVAQANQQMDAYYDARLDFAELSDALLSAPPRDWPRLGMLEQLAGDVARVLEDADHLFEELGHLPEEGEFDAEILAYCRIERQIANRKLRALDQIPETFRERFRPMFEAGPDGQQEPPRDTDAIHSDLGDVQEYLESALAALEQFLLAQGEDRDDPQAGAVVCFVDDQWPVYQQLAVSLSRHF